MALLGCATFAGFIALGLDGVFYSVPLLLLPARYFILGCSLLVGYLVFTLGWYPFRLWAYPPVGLVVTSDGIEFKFLRGKNSKVSWERPGLKIVILDRKLEPGEPASAELRLHMDGGRTDLRYAWKRLTPLTYLTRPAMQTVIAQAKAAGLRVRRLEPSYAFALARSSSRVTYIIPSDEP